MEEIRDRQTDNAEQQQLFSIHDITLSHFFLPPLILKPWNGQFVGHTNSNGVSRLSLCVETSTCMYVVRYLLGELPSQQGSELCADYQVQSMLLNHKILNIKTFCLLLWPYIGYAIAQKTALDG